jgi:hypothetical protein
MLLEDDALDLRSGSQVEPAGQGQHHASMVAGLLNAHPSLSADVQDKHLAPPTVGPTGTVEPTDP